MASLNKVQIIGNVGKDPELRYTPSGSAVCTVSLATSRKWTDKASGEKREETDWHRVCFFDRLADVAGQYLKQGHPCYVEGRLRTRKWTDKEGRDQYTTEIMAENLQLLGGREPRQDGQQASRPAQPRQAAARQAPTPKASGSKAQAPTGFVDMDDDIPF